MGQVMSLLDRWRGGADRGLTIVEVPPHQPVEDWLIKSVPPRDRYREATKHRGSRLPVGVAYTVLPSSKKFFVGGFPMHKVKPIGTAKVYTIGVDVGRRFHLAVVLDERGEEVGSFRVVNRLKEIAEFGEEVMRKFAGRRRFCIEMLDGHAAPLVRELTARGEEVWLCHPYGVKRLRESLQGENKSDRIDARAIAEYALARGEGGRRLRHRDGYVRALRGYSRHLRRLREELVRVGQKIEAAVVGYCPDLLTSGSFPKPDSDTFGAILEHCLPLSKLKGKGLGRKLERWSRGRYGEEAACALLRAVQYLRIEPEEEAAVCLELKHLLARRRQLLKEIAEVEGKIEEMVAGSEAAQALCREMAGIGPLTAAFLMGEVGDITAFARESSFAHFCGVTPKVTQSGSRRQTALCQQSQKRIAGRLYITNLSAIRSEGADRVYFEKKRKETHAKKALIALGRHRVRKIYRILQEHSWRPVAPAPPCYAGRVA